jgi:hypothetical protein
MSRSKFKTCSICGRKLEGHGNNAHPVSKGQCCNACNATVVIPARIRQLRAKDADVGETEKKTPQ